VYLPEQGVFVVGSLIATGATSSSEADAFQVQEEVSSLPLPAFSPVVDTSPDEILSLPVPALVLPSPTSFVFVSPKPALPPPALLIFGNEADIRLARLRQGKRPRRTLPKLKHPVMVKDIPAEEARLPVLALAELRDDATMELPSWWEVGDED
jgi:hypothetical protein